MASIIRMVIMWITPPLLLGSVGRELFVVTDIAQTTGKGPYQHHLEEDR